MEKIEVARRIKELREKNHLSQNALANLAGVSPTYIYQLERGEKSPTIEYLNYICGALNISLNEFFSSNDTVFSVNSLSETQLEYLNTFLNSIGHK
ncbi:MAG TPA: XRE family transcriptional regulator [Firmicutes bacterium]|nr:XRE family transcriptional regulator [Bacillota bacterium]